MFFSKQVSLSFEDFRASEKGEFEISFTLQGEREASKMTDLHKIRIMKRLKMNQVRSGRGCSVTSDDVKVLSSDQFCD